MFIFEVAKNIKMKALTYLIDIFYPPLCLSCDRKLNHYERIICSYCQIQLPKTNFHLKPNNPVEILFWGRCEINAAAALYRYIKKGKVQNLIHNFKYRGFQEIGIFLGEKYGVDLMQSKQFTDVDYIIPIPLHPKKQKKRGFNQSEIFGKGLEKSMKATLEINNLYRKVHTDTQTKKNRWERYKNVESIFDIRDKEKLKSKHLLLVDDVITTGSTMEACVLKLQEIEGVKISIAAIATAAH